MVIDKDARYTGSVMSFYKWQGYGFIKLDQAGVVPDDKLWVHWSNIQTNDRYPFLIQGQQVECGIMKWVDSRTKAASLRAKTVTAPSGALIMLQDEVDLQKKTFVGEQKLRYTGLLKFYLPRKGFGYVALDDGFALPEPVPKELRVDESEVNCGGRRPQSYMENVQVEFGIVKTKRGQCMVYNMTLPGGFPMLKENLEHRQPLGTQVWQGTVSFYQWRQGWGFVAPDPSVPLPTSIQLGLDHMHQLAQQKKPDGPAERGFYFGKADVEKGLWPKQGMTVTFQVYADDKGVGACNIAEVPQESQLE